jgi:hypothetical protein
MKYGKKMWVAVILLFGLLNHVMANEDDPGLNVYYGEIPAGDRIFFIAPDGDNNNSGTPEEPWASLDYAMTQTQPGDVFVLRGGIYYHDERINITGYYEGNPVTIVAYPGEVPVLDFSSMPKDHSNTNYIGMRITAWYVHIIGITVRYAGNNGIRMDGSHNILEQVTAYGNNDTGIHMASNASYNLIRNSDSFHNFNETGRVGNNADGFSAKFDILPGNKFYGCRAWENSDDGFDFWRAANTIVVENCWAFGNGDASVFGNPDNFEGNGNGFKLGGDNVRGDHIVIRSVAFDNIGYFSDGRTRNAKGFDFNNNPGAMTLIHNTAFNNGRNYVFPIQPNDEQSFFINNLSVLPVNLHAQLPLHAVVVGNSWQYETDVTADMFLSIDTEPAKGPRQEDGSLPDIDLLRPVPDSFIVNGGVAIAEPFYGTAPDIGAYEYGDGELVDPWIARGSGNIISGLIVYDMENASNWEILDEFIPDTEAFGDRDYTIASIPGLITVDEWLRTSMESRTKNYLGVYGEFEITESKHVMIAHPDRVTSKPEWLAEYEASDLKIVISESDEIHRELTIYFREAGAGELISLGKNSNDGTTSSLMYLVMVGTIDPVSVDALPDIPTDFALLQNYPNPFNPSTTIKYHVPHRTNVSIKIYDVMGREITELVNGYHEAGSHSVVWNANSFTSGVYYYRITADDYSDVRRLLLLK